MSFDIYLRQVPTAPCPTCGHADEEGIVHDWSGCTHNLNGMIELALSIACSNLGVSMPQGKDPTRHYIERSWGRLDGHRAGDLLSVMEEFARVFIAPEHEQELRALNPPNGWGSLEQVRERELIPKLVDAMRRHPNAVFWCQG